MSSLDSIRYILESLIHAEIIEGKIPHDTLKVALHNGLFLAICDLVKEKTDIPKRYRELYFQQRKTKEETVILFQKVLDCCQSNGVSVFTIKSFLPYPYIDTNIDVVNVNQKSKQILVDIFEGLGYRRHFSLSDIREPRKMMYRHQTESQLLPKLHLHQDISWNGVVYLDRNLVWERHQSYQAGEVQIPIPSPEDELLIMAAHVLFENKYLTLGDLYYFHLLLGNDLDWDYIQRSTHRHAWGTALSNFIETMSGFAEAVDLPLQSIPDIWERKSITVRSIPYIIPLFRSFNGTFSKLIDDISRLRLKTIPRELFSYCLVDPLWMYRKALQKPKAKIC